MFDILNKKVRKLTVAALLVAVAIFAIQPSLAHAQSQTGYVTITAQGSATPTANTTGTGSSSAFLYVKGTANVNGENIQLTGMSGIFQIGPEFFTIVGGQGQANNGTMIQLSLQVSGSSAGSLVLQGQTTISGEGYTVLFTPQQSNLQSQYSLWMHGNLWVDITS